MAWWWPLLGRNMKRPYLHLNTTEVCLTESICYYCFNKQWDGPYQEYSAHTTEWVAIYVTCFIHYSDNGNTGRVQKFLAWHTKAVPNGKCCEGYTVPSTATSQQIWKVCSNKGRTHWKTAKLFHFCHLKKLVSPETFGPYYVCVPKCLQINILSLPAASVV
jgi:hypothetical protein